MEREKFGSRLGFILVSAGCAVGLGNVWKFPYMCGQYGGAAFIAIYLVFLVILGYPIIVCEFAHQEPYVLNVQLRQPVAVLNYNRRNNPHKPTKTAHFYVFLWFAKVKYVKSSSFSYSIKFAQSLFYRFNQNELVHNKLQIRDMQWFDKLDHPFQCYFDRRLCFLWL